MATVIGSVEQAMAKAKSFAKKGNPAKAIQIYQAVLARYPTNKRAATALANLQSGAGASILSRNDPAKAEIQQYKKLLNAGKTDAALEFGQSLLRKYPRAAVVPNMVGTALVILGRHDEAIEQLKRAVAMQPNNFEIITNLAGAYSEAEDWAASHAEYSKAIKIRPDYAPAYSNRARVCLEARKYEDAVDDAQMALSLDASDMRAELTLGRAYAGFFELEKSYACYSSILDRHPKSYLALVGRASALISLGRTPEAIKDFERSLEINPNLVASHYSLSKLKKFTPDDPQIAAMLKLADVKDMDARSKAQIYFGLCGAYEKLGDSKTAFKYLALGNKARHDDNDYSIDNDRKLFQNIKDYFGNMAPEPITSVHNNNSPRPIFILGMPRSGTTLTEQILSSHSTVHGAGELKALGNVVSKWFNDNRDRPQGADAQTMLKNIRKGYFSDPHITATALPAVTDKMPMNFLWIGFIIAAFPEARIVHLNRDPMAVCWSNYRQLFSATGLKYAYDLESLGQYFLLYRDMMAFWRDLYPGRIYDLNYEELTRNQEPETRKLLAACDLDWEDACLDFHRNKRSISTASATQVRKKMYQGSSAAWKKYETELVTLRDVLGDLALDQKNSTGQ